MILPEFAACSLSWEEKYREVDATSGPIIHGTGIYADGPRPPGENGPAAQNGLGIVLPFLGALATTRNISIRGGGVGSSSVK